jgi:hypothetical protein
MRLVFHRQVYSDLANIIDYYERVATRELADDFYHQPAHHFVTQSSSP